MQDTDLLTWIDDDTAAIAELLNHAAPTDEVPTCPEWTIADLLEHLVIQFSNWLPANLTTPVESHDLAKIRSNYQSSSEDHLSNVTRLEKSVSDFIDLCRRTDLNQPRWAFGGVEPARFWVRRAACEMTVHLTDAAASTFSRPSTPPHRVSEAIDETLTGMWPKLAWTRKNFRRLPAPTVPAEPAAIHATDTGRTWTLHRGDDGTPTTTTGSINPGLSVGHAFSADLLAWLWGRPTRHPLHIDGDRLLLDRWNLMNQN